MLFLPHVLGFSCCFMLAICGRYVLEIYLLHFINIAFSVFLALLCYFLFSIIFETALLFCFIFLRLYFFYFVSRKVMVFYVQWKVFRIKGKKESGFKITLSEILRDIDKHAISFSIIFNH